jgi:hypothetical protein
MLCIAFGVDDTHFHYYIYVSVLQQMMSQKPTRPSTPMPNIRHAAYMPSHLKSLEFCCSFICGVAIRMRCNCEPPVRPADFLRSTTRPGVRMSYKTAGGDKRERRSIHSFAQATPILWRPAPRRAVCKSRTPLGPPPCRRARPTQARAESSRHGTPPRCRRSKWPVALAICS